MKNLRSLATLLLLLCGCGSQSKEVPTILVTIAPYQQLLQTLVGDRARVTVLVPPGVSPHTYDPPAREVIALGRTRVWFTVGDPMEEKMVALLRPRGVTIVNIGRPYAHTPSKCSCSDTHHDPHVWMDPSIVQQQVRDMADVLRQQFPEFGDLIQDNCDLLTQQLVQLDAEIGQQLHPFQGEYLLVSHPGLGYFCARYHMHQLALETEGRDLRPHDLQHLLHALEQHPVPVILTQPQYNNKGAALLAEQLHIPTTCIDTYESDYAAMLHRIAQTIVYYYEH